MKVLIDGVLVDSDRQAITLLLSDEDKELISRMGDARIYCRYPDDVEPHEAEAMIAEMNRRSSLTPRGS